MTAAEALDRGRQSFRRQGWAEAYARLSEAARESALACEDLELLATAAYLWAGTTTAPTPGYAPTTGS